MEAMCDRDIVFQATPCIRGEEIQVSISACVAIGSMGTTRGFPIVWNIFQSRFHIQSVSLLPLAIQKKIHQG